MSYCSKCSTKINDGVKFCPNCGTQLDGVKGTQRVSNPAQGEPKKKMALWKKIGIGFIIFAVIGALTQPKDGKTESNDKTNTLQKTEEVSDESIKAQKGQVQVAEEETVAKEDTNPISKFKGTYRFDYHGTETSIIIVSEDGRCVLKEHGNSMFLGNVEPISANAFKLRSNGELHFIMDVNFYNQGQYGGYTASSHWMINEVVFDLSENKLYRKKSEYDNRDIVRAEYTIMTHDSSTQSTTRTCKTCGKEYIPDNEAIVSQDYCYADYPQTCNRCGKTYTINTDGSSACLGTCSSCSAKHTSVRIYEETTGRKIY